MTVRRKLTSSICTKMLIWCNISVACFHTCRKMYGNAKINVTPSCLLIKTTPTFTGNKNIIKSLVNRCNMFICFQIITVFVNKINYFLVSAFVPYCLELYCDLYKRHLCCTYSMFLDTYYSEIWMNVMTSMTN